MDRVSGAALRRATYGVLCATALCGITGAARAGVIVNDRFSDGTRNDPPPTLTVPFTTTYSENGVDQDGDSDIESAWFSSPTAALTASAGHLTMTQQTGSSSYTTYFGPGNSAIALPNAGDQLKITYVFKPTGINSTSTSQGLRFAVVDNPDSTLPRLTADGTPGTPAAGSTYHGYALFANMRTGTLGNSNAFQLLKRADSDATPAAFLSSTGAYTATGFTNSTVNNSTTPGYTEGATDTLVMLLTRLAGPDGISGTADDQLNVTATMTGTGLGAGGQGFVTQSATDTTPTGFQFDTFGIRPSTAADTATTFDTTQFRVDYIPVPEPMTLGALGGLMLLARRRRV